MNTKQTAKGSGNFTSILSPFKVWILISIDVLSHMKEIDGYNYMAARIESMTINDLGPNEDDI